MKFIPLFLMLITSTALAGKPTAKLNLTFFVPATQTQITQEQLLDQLAQSEIIIMGEKHYTEAVQKAEGTIISSVTATRKNAKNFTTAWEFLNFTDQTMLQKLFAKFVKGEVSAAEFLKMTQGMDEAVVYSPVLESTKAGGGDFIGVNISRQDKKPILNGGIKAANPTLVPPGFANLGDNYRERFMAIAGGHFPENQRENAYSAQCLTDDVMAYHLLNDSQKDLRFLVAGSFHTDFNDGTVARVKIRAPKARVTTIKIIDASDYETAAELIGDLNDAKYGPVADFAFIVNEPTPQPPASFQFVEMPSERKVIKRSWLKTLTLPVEPDSLF